VVSAGAAPKAATVSAVPPAAAHAKQAAARTDAPPAAPAAPRARAPLAGYQGGIVHARANQELIAQAEAAYAARAQALAEQENAGVWRTLLQSLKLQPAMPLLLAVVAALALGWLGIRALIGHRTQAPALAASQVTVPQQPSAAAPAPSLPTAPPAGVPARTQPVQAGAEGASAVVHEEIPSVPQRARRTIRGHIHVSVRVIVDQDGNVTAALVDSAGPSRYFARLAIEAAKKWTFAPAPSEPRRLKSVRFDFGREGTSGHAVALH
jgi:TonB family protein